MICSLKGSREVTSGRPRFFGSVSVAAEFGMSASLPSLSLEVADMVEDIVLNNLMVQERRWEHCGGEVECLCGPP
jgi:hypothetical protein